MTDQTPSHAPDGLSLSVVIIARNEAHNIADCVKSAAFANEVLVLDSGSTDATAELARQQGAKVMVTDWPGFGAQKNRALSAASGAWVYSLDADERIMPELAKEIRSVIASDSDVVAYRVPRRSQFCGQFMRYSGWWPDYTLRLVKAGQGQFSEKQVHESLIVQGKVGTLKSPMLHYSYRNLDDVLSKLNHYSTAGARDRIASGKSASLIGAVGHGLWAFIRTYFLRLGLLDGKLGFVLAVYNAEASYYKYLKNWLQNRH